LLKGARWQMRFAIIAESSRQEAMSDRVITLDTPVNWSETAGSEKFRPSGFIFRPLRTTIRRSSPRGAHVIDLAQLGLGTDDTGPVEIEARGQATTGGLYNAFFNFNFTNRFANGVTMIGSSEEPRGLRFEGADGWLFIHVHGAKLEASDPSILADLEKWKATNGEIHKLRLGRSVCNDQPAHIKHPRNFLDSVRTRRPTVAPAEVGHRTASICHLNNIAMLTGRKLKWDPIHEKVTNDAEAQKLCTPVMRNPWSLSKG